MEELEKDMIDNSAEEKLKELQKKEEELKKRERKLRRRVLLLILLLLLLIGGCSAYLWDRKENDGIEREIAAEVGIMPGMTPEEIQDRLNRRVAESRLNASINTEPVFENG